MTPPRPACYYAPMPPTVVLNKVSKCYGAAVAVAGLSLEVERGEVLGLLGPNGAGKSTTLQMISGLVRPTSGAVTVFGRDLRRNFVEVASRMGVFVERPAFHPYLSVRRTLGIHARLARRQLNMGRLLETVGLRDKSHAKVGSLSRGQQQRLGLALAMLTEPELLVLDEPTAGLDVESTQEVLQLLRRLARESSVTILFSSHLLHEVELLCDRVAVLNEGKLVACEQTDDLLSYDQRRLEVLIDGAEGAAKRLAGQNWVESAIAKNGRLYVRLIDPNPHQLVSFLVASGYQVSGVIPRRHTLRDYFLKVMNP